MNEQMVTVHLAQKRAHRTSKDEPVVEYGPGTVVVPASVAEQWGEQGAPVKPTIKTKASDN